MAVRKTCDICKMSRQRIDPATLSPIDDVVRYTLRREMNQARESGGRTRRYQKSAGGIDLCGNCWDGICGPRTNPKKGSNRRPFTAQAESSA
jgi:hypothetical protein